MKIKAPSLAMEPRKLIKYNYWSSMPGIEDKPENYTVRTLNLKRFNHSIFLRVTIASNKFLSEKILLVKYNTHDRCYAKTGLSNDSYLLRMHSYL